jgi:restriction endonuclease Mrr
MVPKFDSFMYPALEYLKDGQVRTNKEIYAHLRNVFKLTDEDMDEKVEKVVQAEPLVI